MFRYDQIIRYKQGDIIDMYLKSYLDRQTIDDIEKKLNNKYIFTFNISNIYFGINNIIPLIKCNRCEVV